MACMVSAVPLSVKYFVSQSCCPLPLCSPPASGRLLLSSESPAPPASGTALSMTPFHPPARPTHTRTPMRLRGIVVLACAALAGCGHEQPFQPLDETTNRPFLPGSARASHVQSGGRPPPGVAPRRLGVRVRVAAACPVRPRPLPRLHPCRRRHPLPHGLQSCPDRHRLDRPVRRALAVAGRAPPVYPWNLPRARRLSQQRRRIPRTAVRSPCRHEAVRAALHHTGRPDALAHLPCALGERQPRDLPRGIGGLPARLRRLSPGHRHRRPGNRGPRPGRCRPVNVGGARHQQRHVDDAHLGCRYVGVFPR